MIPWVKYAKFLGPYEENASERRNKLKLFLTELPKERGFFFIESQPASRCRFWFLFAAPPLDGKHFQGKAPRALCVPTMPRLVQQACRKLSGHTGCPGFEWLSMAGSAKACRRPEPGEAVDSSTFSKRGPRLLLTASDTHLKDRPAGLFLYRVCDEKKVQKVPSTQWTLDKWQVLPDCLHSGYKERNEGFQNLRVSGARTWDPVCTKRPKACFP